MTLAALQQPPRGFAGDPEDEDKKMRDQLALQSAPRGVVGQMLTSPESRDQMVNGLMSQPAPGAVGAPQQPTMQVPAPSGALAGLKDPASISTDFPSENAYWQDHSGELPMRPQPAHKTSLTQGLLLGIADAAVGWEHPEAKHFVNALFDKKMQTEQAQEEYDRNLPMFKHQQYQTDQGKFLTDQNMRSEIQQRAMTNPRMAKALELYNKLKESWSSNSLSKDQFMQQAISEGNISGVGDLISPYVQGIMGLPQKSAAEIEKQDDLPTAVVVRGRDHYPVQYDGQGKPVGFNINGKTTAFNDQSLPAEVKDMLPELQTAYEAHATKRGEKLSDETFVANAAAQRQGNALGAAMNATSAADERRQHFAAAADATKLSNEHQTSKADYQTNMSLFDRAMKGDAVAGAMAVLKATGIAIPEGTKRLNQQEIDMVRNAGNIDDKTKGAIIGAFGSGVPVDQKILQEYKDALYTKEKNSSAARQTQMDTINRNYGSNFTLEAPPAAPQQATQQSAGTVSWSDVLTAARANGKTPAQAEADAKSKGYTITGKPKATKRK